MRSGVLVAGLTWFGEKVELGWLAHGLEKGYGFDIFAHGLGRGWYG